MPTYNNANVWIPYLKKGTTKNFTQLIAYVDLLNKSVDKYSKHVFDLDKHQYGLYGPITKSLLGRTSETTI